jgi:hypothetical protein
VSFDGGEGSRRIILTGPWRHGPLFD